MPDGLLTLTNQTLKTPRAAAVAGILFAVLFSGSVVLIRLSIPANVEDSGVWLKQRAGTVTLALSLLPFAGIAFLWFMGVVRDRLGRGWRTSSSRPCSLAAACCLVVSLEPADKCDGPVSSRQYGVKKGHDGLIHREHRALRGPLPMPAGTHGLLSPTITLCIRCLQHLRLRPRRHPAQQDLSQRPDVIRQPCGPRRRPRLLALR